MSRRCEAIITARAQAALGIQSLIENEQQCVVELFCLDFAITIMKKVPKTKQNKDF